MDLGKKFLCLLAIFCILGSCIAAVSAADSEGYKVFDDGNDMYVPGGDDDGFLNDTPVLPPVPEYANNTQVGFADNITPLDSEQVNNTVTVENNTDPITVTNNTHLDSEITVNMTHIEEVHCNQLQSSNDCIGSKDCSMKSKWWDEYLKRNGYETTAEEDAWMEFYMQIVDDQPIDPVLYFITTVAGNHNWKDTVKIVSRTFSMSPFQVDGWKITEGTATQKDVEQLMNDIAAGKYVLESGGSYATIAMKKHLMQKTFEEAGSVIHNLYNLLFK